MRILDNIGLDFKDVLFVPKRSELNSRQEVDLCRSYTFRNSKQSWTGIPVMAANMDGVGTFEMAQQLQQHRLFTCIKKDYNLADWTAAHSNLDYQHVAVSVGTSNSDFKKLQLIINGIEHIQFICVDVANGYSEHFGEFVSKIRKEFPTKTIIAGNVVTADMTQELLLRGADIIKVGIGPGSVCTTRIQTGVGYPQLSAIIECADAAHGLGGHIIADGGCTCPGDVAKAFGAGADFVMLGGMLAGHDEGGGDIITEIESTFKSRNGISILSESKFVEFYGMSSETAMDRHHGGVASYRSSEGKTVSIPYRGPVLSTVLDTLGGLRSTCTYIGAHTLKELSKCTTFVRVSQQVNNIFGH